VSIEHLIKGVHVLLSSKIAKKDIVYTTRFAPGVPDVYVDENQIEQVLINLFLNAIDAMEPGGRLTVSTSLQAKTQETDSPPMVAITLEDQGCGIEKENLKKIFNPFFTTKNDGVGLGLSISTRLVEENGGRIDVESEPGKGSRFAIVLPTG
jgi:two-component system NtrC family sensor kinase